MVSTNSTPPMPLPMQVPPGHLVQQIIDQNGTLQHVILTLDPMSQQQQQQQQQSGTTPTTPAAPGQTGQSNPPYVSTLY